MQLKNYFLFYLLPKTVHFRKIICGLKLFWQPQRNNYGTSCIEKRYTTGTHVQYTEWQFKNLAISHEYNIHPHSPNICHLPQYHISTLTKMVFNDLSYTLCRVIQWYITIKTLLKKKMACSSELNIFKYFWSKNNIYQVNLHVGLLGGKKIGPWPLKIIKLSPCISGFRILHT